MFYASCAGFYIFCCFLGSNHKKNLSLFNKKPQQAQKVKKGSAKAARGRGSNNSSRGQGRVQPQKQTERYFSHPSTNGTSQLDSVPYQEAPATVVQFQEYWPIPRDTSTDDVTAAGDFSLLADETEEPLLASEELLPDGSQYINTNSSIRMTQPAGGRRMIRPLLSISQLAPPTQPLVAETESGEAVEDKPALIAGEVEGARAGWFFCPVCNVSVANVTKLNLVSLMIHAIYLKFQESPSCLLKNDYIPVNFEVFAFNFSIFYFYSIILLSFIVIWISA